MAKRKSKESPQPVKFVTIVKEGPVAFEPDNDYELEVDPIPPANRHPSDSRRCEGLVYIDGEASKDLNVGDVVVLELTDTQVRGWGDRSLPPAYWRIVKYEHTA